MSGLDLGHKGSIGKKGTVPFSQVLARFLGYFAFLLQKYAIISTVNLLYKISHLGIVSKFQVLSPLPDGEREG